MNQIIVEIVREKKYLFGALLTLIVINLALMLFIAYFQSDALSNALAKWSELRRQSLSVGHADAAALYRRGVLDLEKLNSRIPLKRELGRVLSELIESAASNAVTFGSISYKPSSIKEVDLISYQLTFSVSGGYAAVKSYLADLQKNPELIVVDDFSLTNNDNFVENVTMNLRLTLYLRGGA